MILSDVKIRVKRTFGDESAVQVTDDDITRWANDAQRYIVLNNDDILQKSAVLSSVVGQQDYALPTDLLNLISVHYRVQDALSYFHMTYHSFAQFDSAIDGWDGLVYGSGQPSIYTVFENVLKIFPVPAIDSVDGIKYYYNRKPTDLVSDSDSIDLPIEYHNAVVAYCMSQAYELDENYEASGAKYNQVDRDLATGRKRDKRAAQEKYQTITTLPEDE